MLKDKQRQYHAQLEELKETLISADTHAQIEDILFPVRLERELSKNKPYEAPFIQPQLSTKDNYMDFYAENNDLFDQDENKKIGREDDPYRFFKQAASQIDRPVSWIKHFCKHPNDPDTFATLTVASKFFRNKNIQLKELMCFTDYKKLTRLRIQNYIYILRIFTQIDKTLYPQVKDRLLKIQGLCDYLGFTDKGSEIQKVYSRLGQDQQIYDLEKPVDGEQEKEDSSFQDKESLHEDQEYSRFFSKSYLSQIEEPDEDELFSNSLINEEEKWQLRSKWIQEVLENIRNNYEQKDWSPWIEARVASLSDLDIIVNKKDDKFGDYNTEVFYLYDFLEKQLKFHTEKVSNQDGSEDFLNDRYTHYQMLNNEDQNYYPQVNFKTTKAQNDSLHQWFRKINIRSKFCLKIQQREQDTEFFLQVFKRRNFGNEKIFEKRLNLRGRHLYVRKMEFQQDPGNFLFLSFFTKEPTEENQSKDDLIEEDDQEKENNDDEKVSGNLENETESNFNELDYNFAAEYNIQDEDSNDEQCINDEVTSHSSNNSSREDGLKINLIFSIKSQNKDPLLVKPNSKFLGFFGNKKFLTYKIITLDIKDKSQKLKDQASQKALRIYEHDLFNFCKIKTIDLVGPYSEVTKADIFTKRFGRLKDRSFYYIYEKNFNKENELYKEFIFMKNKDEIPIQLAHKISKGQKEEIAFIEKFYPNEKGDKFLMVQKIQHKYIFQRYSLDIKDQSNKKYKVDNIQYDKIHEHIGERVMVQDLRLRVLPVNNEINDYLIIVFKEDKELIRKMHIFINNKLLCESSKNSEFYYLPGVISFQFNENKTAIAKIFQQIQDIDSPRDFINLKQQVYDVFDIQNPKKEWYRVTYPLLNQDVTVAYPNMFFIYNHDQLYMKDMTQPNLQGYFYMNHFLGIKQNHRPLCVQNYRHSNSQIINIPIIENNYSEKQFFLRVNQLSTFAHQSNPQQIINSNIHYFVFSFNEKVSEVHNIISKLITNEDGVLEKDIRIYNKNNSLIIEKIHQTGCFQRAIINQFDEINFSKRDVTILINNNSDTNNNASLEEKYNSNPITFIPQSQRFVTVQKRDSVEIWQFNTNFEGYSFADILFSDFYKKVWQYQSDEISNQILDILVDPMPKNFVDFYLLQQQGLMKKISYSIKDKKFTEYQYQYQIDRIYQNNSMTEFGKNIFIANQILYSEDKIINLNAEVFLQEKKIQLGQDMPSLPNKAKNVQGFSPYDGTFIANDNFIKEEIVESQDLIIKYVLLPLFNVRMLPQFHQTQFNHPIAPLVDLKQGFTCVFTLNLYQSDMCDCEKDQIENQKINIMLHEQSQFYRYQQYYNLSPGLLIRYFNGIEQRISIQEKIIQVNRFTISKDGYNIVIQGLQLKEKPDSINGELILMNGLFIYQISKANIRQVSLSQFIPFAEYKPQLQTSEIIRKEFGIAEQETDCVTFGHFDTSTEKSLKKYFSTIFASNYKERFEFKDLDLSDQENESEYIKISSSILDLQKEKNREVKVTSKQQNEDVEQVKDQIIGEVQNNFYSFDLLAPNIDYDIFQKIDCFFSTKYKNYIEYQNSKLNNKRIEKIHDNLKIVINENGHLFIINRLNNKVYFFYKDGSDEYKVFKFVIPEFIVEGVDSSTTNIIFWSSDNFLVFDISLLIQQKSSDQNLLQQSKWNTQPVKVSLEDFIQIRQRPLQQNLQENTVSNNYVEPYQFIILDCKIIEEKIIFQIEEKIDSNNKTNYVKIFDMKKQVLVNYFEYDQIMLSGDKKYVWFPSKNKVYDIQNNLTTIFLWAQGCFNCHGMDSMDVFNVSDDRSIMVTHGILYLSFNLLSSFIQIQNINDLIPTQSDYKSKNIDFFYNLPGQISLLKTILNEKVDLPQESQKVIDSKRIDVDNQIKRENLMLRLNNYILKNGFSNLQNNDNYAHFLLSYYEMIENKTGETIIQNVFQILFQHNSQRFDIIEDMLNTVVQIIDTPITKNSINKSFLDFLKNIDNSQAFRDYFDKCIQQTSVMQITTKYPIVSSQKQGLTIESSISPIIDEGFHQKFQGEKELKKDVTIQYIFLGDLLIDQGQEILILLNDIKYLGILNIPFLYYLVNFQWKRVQNAIKKKTLYPFFIRLFFFTVYSIQFVSYIDDLPSITSDSTIQFTTAYYVLILVQFLMIGYFIYVEIEYFIVDKSKYISTFLNYIDLFINLLCFMVPMLDLMGNMQNVLRPVASSTLIIVWIKLFYYFRAYDSTSKLIRMIIEICKDIRYFLLVLFIGIFGFAGGFYILQFGLSSLQQDKDSNDHLFVGSNPILAFIYIYQMVMGNFNVSNFSEFENLNTFEFYYAWFLFVISCLFLVIVMMNLLIAIMGNTFQNLQSSILNLQIRELVLLISENEQLFKRSIEFKNSQYLIIITEKQSSSSSVATVEKQINLLKDQLIDKVSILESQFTLAQSTSQNELRRKFQDQQERQKQNLREAETSYNAELKKQHDFTVQKISQMFNQLKDQYTELKDQFNEQKNLIQEIKHTVRTIKSD